MIDTSGIDIKAVIDQMTCVAWKKPVRSHGEMVYKGGPCPFCGSGIDRFAVFVTGEKPHFYCGIHGNGCGEHGDVIRFVQLIRGYTSIYQAICELQEMGFEVGDKRIAHTKMVRTEPGKPGLAWQEKGNALVHAASRYLWSSVGSPAREYLHKRGFTDETIKRFRLGYWPKWMEYTLASWGLATAQEKEEATFWIRPGIIIPWYEGNTLWKINQRITEYSSKERELMAQGKALPRYKAIRGSGNGLFNVDAVLPDQPCILTEGEFCAMTLAQETDCVAVATGSTQGARVSRWVAALSLASHLLVAFDNDQGKGEGAATYWLGVFEDKASLWLPWAKDINDMLQEGMDIATWVALGRQLASNAKSVPIEENRCDHSRENVVPAQSAIETDGSLCFACLNEDRETPASFAGPDDIMYCKFHYNGLSSEIHKADVEAVAERFRRAFPDWKVTVEARWTRETRRER
jgi:DNA primase